MSDSKTSGKRAVHRALISVYDKTGLEVLAQGLHDAGVALVSTGSTASRIAAAGVPVTRVEDLTGFPECLDGRVKTLHPTIHARLLADMRNPAPVPQRADRARTPADLVRAQPEQSARVSGAQDACSDTALHQRRELEQAQGVRDLRA